MSEYWVKLRESVDKMLGRQPSTPTAPPAAETGDPAIRDPDADANKARHDLEDKVIDESDRRPPPPA